MHFNNHNNLIYKVHNVEKISSWRWTETDRVSERPKVRLKPTFKGSYCSRSFDNGRDYIAYLGQGRSDGGRPILVYIYPHINPWKLFGALIVADDVSIQNCSVVQ